MLPPIKNLLKKILSSRLFEKVGLSLINYDMVLDLNHYLWIFKIFSTPKLKINYKEKINITNDDINLCERLLKSYKEASLAKIEPEKRISPLWAYGLKEKYGKLLSALESEDPKTLASNLSLMFRESFVYGLASGDLFKHSNSIIGNKIWSLKYYDNITKLAEYLGVVRTESTAQGEIAPVFRENLDLIVKNIERHLKIPINFPDVGAPWGIMKNGSLVTMEHPEHIYVSLKIHLAIKTYLGTKSHQNLNLVEIGGGYGGLAFLTHILGRVPINSYTIIDLPIINVLQGYFLSKAIHPWDVCLFGESPKDTSRYYVLPTFAFKSINHEIDLLINENSMPEMTDEIVEDYIRVARDKMTRLFFSYNHEASVPNLVLVPEIMNRVGGFERMERSASWMRNGYVEEVYTKTF